MGVDTVYTPSEDYVFFAYAYGMENSPLPDMGSEKLAEYRKEFDRWLEEHDMEVREEVRQEAFTDGYARGFDDGHSEGERYVYDMGAWDLEEE